MSEVSEREEVLKGAVCVLSVCLSSVYMCVFCQG